VQFNVVWVSTIPSRIQSFRYPDWPFPSPSRLPQSSASFMSLSEHDRWNVDSPTLDVPAASVKISQITSLGDPAKPLTAHHRDVDLVKIKGAVLIQFCVNIRLQTLLNAENLLAPIWLRLRFVTLRAECRVTGGCPSGR
jgi:hypothetical protein